MYDFKEFNLYCNKGFCLRKSIYNAKTCQREKKQERCFVKYMLKMSAKFQVDTEYNKFVVKVWNETFEEGYTGFSTRDNWKNYCQIWAILSAEERDYVETHYKDDVWINRSLDVCHIKEKDISPELKYDSMNGVIVGRYFHTLLDNFRHPVTRKLISKEERFEWFMKAKKNSKKDLL